MSPHAHAPGGVRRYDTIDFFPPVLFHPMSRPKSIPRRIILATRMPLFPSGDDAIAVDNTPSACKHCIVDDCATIDCAEERLFCVPRELMYVYIQYSTHTSFTAVGSHARRTRSVPTAARTRHSSRSIVMPLVVAAAERLRARRERNQHAHTHKGGLERPVDSFLKIFRF